MYGSTPFEEGLYLEWFLLSTGGGEKSLIYKERILSKYERDLQTKKKFTINI